MPESNLAAPHESLNWMYIGQIPPAVTAWQADRLRKAQLVGGVGGGLLIGGLAGVASNVILSGPGTFAWNIPLLLGVAIPVGIGSFFFNRWIIPRVAGATQFQFQQVAISSDKLHLEQETGKIVEWPLKRIRVSNDAIAGGWFVVSLPAGRTSFSFWAPPMVANSIRTAAKR